MHLASFSRQAFHLGSACGREGAGAGLDPCSVLSTSFRSLEEVACTCTWTQGCRCQCLLLSQGSVTLSQGSCAALCSCLHALQMAWGQEQR